MDAIVEEEIVELEEIDDPDVRIDAALRAHPHYQHADQWLVQAEVRHSIDWVYAASFMSVAALAVLSKLDLRDGQMVVFTTLFATLGSAIASNMGIFGVLAFPIVLAIATGGSTVLIIGLMVGVLVLLLMRQQHQDGPLKDWQYVCPAGAELRGWAKAKDVLNQVFRGQDSKVLKGRHTVNYGPVGWACLVGPLAGTIIATVGGPWWGLTAGVAASVSLPHLTSRLYVENVEFRLHCALHGVPAEGLLKYVVQRANVAAVVGGLVIAASFGADLVHGQSAGEPVVAAPAPVRVPEPPPPPPLEFPVDTGSGVPWHCLCWTQADGSPATACRKKARVCKRLEDRAGAMRGEFHGLLEPCVEIGRASHPQSILDGQEWWEPSAQKGTWWAPGACLLRR